MRPSPNTWKKPVWIPWVWVIAGKAGWFLAFEEELHPPKFQKMQEKISEDDCQDERDDSNKTYTQNQGVQELEHKRNTVKLSKHAGTSLESQSPLRALNQARGGWEKRRASMRQSAARGTPCCEKCGLTAGH